MWMVKGYTVLYGFSKIISYDTRDGIGLYSYELVECCCGYTAALRLQDFPPYYCKVLSREYIRLPSSSFVVGRDHVIKLTGRL